MSSLTTLALPGTSYPGSSSKISLDAIGQLASLSSLLKANVARTGADASIAKAQDAVASLRDALLTVRKKGNSGVAEADEACTLAFALSERRGFAGRFEKVALLALADVLRRTPGGPADRDSKCLSCCEARLFHTEPLVRSAACSVLEIVACRRGVGVWNGTVCACVTKALVENFERQGDEHTSEETAKLVREMVELKLHAAGSGPFAVKPGSDGLMHDTVGWKKLEAGFGALHAVLRGCGRSFVDHGLLTEELCNLISRGATEHMNRFVRETCFMIISAIADIERKRETEQIDSARDQASASASLTLGGETIVGAQEEGKAALMGMLCDTIAIGLSDNWSQVRYAASVALRSFLCKAIEAVPQIGHASRQEPDPRQGQMQRRSQGSALITQYRRPLKGGSDAVSEQLPPGILPSRGRFLAKLIPRMVLNRYYVARGVRLYSQDSWVMVMGRMGVTFLSKPEILRPTVEYYIKSCEADNHAVREAACQCIAELGLKLDKDVLADHVDSLLTALLVCFQDGSWPVRDAACVATGRFASSFMKKVSEMRVELSLNMETDGGSKASVGTESSRATTTALEALFQLWLQHLRDPIWSVREDAAVALGQVLQANNRDCDEVSSQSSRQAVLQRLEEWLTNNLMSAKDQESSKAAPQRRVMGAVHGMTNEEKGFGPAIVSADEPTDKPVYSCGSLAPKLQRGAARAVKLKNESVQDQTGSGGGCCLDGGSEKAIAPFLPSITTPAQKWEVSDGACYLLRELSSVEPERVLPYLSSLAQLAGMTHFKDHGSLHETIWKVLPVIASSIGKRSFRRHLNEFIEPMVRCIAQDGHRLSRAAAVGAAAAIEALIGKGVFRGRIDMVEMETTSSTFTRKSWAEVVQGALRGRECGFGGGEGSASPITHW